MRHRHTPLVLLAGLLPLSACGETHPGSSETADTHSVAEGRSEDTVSGSIERSDSTTDRVATVVGETASELVEGSASAISPSGVVATGGSASASGFGASTTPSTSPSTRPSTTIVVSSTSVPTSPNIPTPPVADTLPADPLPPPSVPISPQCELAPYSSCVGADLRGYDLSYASLQGANLSGVNLAGVDLTGADLMEADLTGANLTGARLDFAFLLGTNFTGARLNRASVADVIWDDSTSWPTGFTPPY